MTWTALIPFKNDTIGKTRLSTRLSAPEREALAQLMFNHVAAVLARSPSITRIVAVAAKAPAGWKGEWIADQGRGLNRELGAARRAVNGPALLIHADLPALGPADIHALLTAAEQRGAAIAPDRHDEGTNALALASTVPFTPAFGANSFARHCAQLGGGAAIVRRPGLGLDVDFARDLDSAIDAGAISWRPAPETPLPN